MLRLYQHSARTLPGKQIVFTTEQVRPASLTSAISRGIRNGASRWDRIGSSGDSRKPQTNESQDAPRWRNPDSRSSESRPGRPTSELYRESLAKPPRSRRELDRLHAPDIAAQKWKTKQERRAVKDFVSREAPLGVPYTTAGSEFIYGTFAVKAAIEAKRRRLYKLYIWKAEDTIDDDETRSVRDLAKKRGVHVERVAGTWDKMLAKMAGQRPHNGFVLEASPLPNLPISRLNAVMENDQALAVGTLPQSLEEQEVNRVFKSGPDGTMIPRNGDTTRFPLLLWLDCITDTGNLGAIIRSAYFLGVDAILVPEHGTAPFSPITIKASAGSAEHLPILTIKKELDFVQQSQSNGWKFFAAVAPDSRSTKKKGHPDIADSDEALALSEAPCVLMVGNEGEGLRPFLQKAADVPISIRGAHGIATGVDSLNVSVAAALLVARLVNGRA